MTFRFAARYGLFTYAQCGDLDPFKVVNLFSDLHAECIIGRENHNDEGIHLHAFVDFGKRFETTDVRKFDVDGQHPNVSPSRGTPEKGYDYAIKDGDIVAGGLERPSGREVSSSSVDWSRIADASNVDEFWSLVRELAPRSLLTNFPSLRAYADWNYRPVQSEYSTPPGITFDLSAVARVNEWLRDNMSGDYVGKESCPSHPVAALPGANLRSRAPEGVSSAVGGVLLVFVFVFANVFV